jgi:glycosyltransferase involved in cell wall biosynthesis
VSRLLAAADIHCQPNLSPEPFGRTFIEALLAGLPVVTTKMGAALEIVNSSCGVLVDPCDAGALAEALSGLIDDPDRRKRQAKDSVARATALCDPKTQLHVFAETLACILPGPVLNSLS